MRLFKTPNCSKNDKPLQRHSINQQYNSFKQEALELPARGWRYFTVGKQLRLEALLTPLPILYYLHLIVAPCWRELTCYLVNDYCCTMLLSRNVRDRSSYSQVLWVFKVFTFFAVTVSFIAEIQTWYVCGHVPWQGPLVKRYWVRIDLSVKLPLVIPTQRGGSNEKVAHRRWGGGSTRVSYEEISLTRLAQKIQDRFRLNLHRICTLGRNRFSESRLYSHEPRTLDELKEAIRDKN